MHTIVYSIYMLQWMCQIRECVYFLKFSGNIPIPWFTQGLYIFPDECVKKWALFFRECVNSLKISGNIYNPWVNQGMCNIIQCNNNYNNDSNSNEKITRKKQASETCGWQRGTGSACRWADTGGERWSWRTTRWYWVHLNTSLSVIRTHYRVYVYYVNTVKLPNAPAFIRKKADIALHGKPISELRDVTCHMESHSVTCHPTQVNASRLTPAMQAGTRFTYPGGMEGWVDLVDLIAPPAGSQTSDLSITSPTPNHCTTKTTER